MKTITNKTAKNGATLWYVDGKRTSRDKAVETDIENGRETLSKLTAGLRADPAVDNDFGIIVEMNDILGGRYAEYFYFATAQDAVTAARKIVALGKQVHCLTIDNGRPYPSNVRYAITARGTLIFCNGFERFNETEEVNNIDGCDESAFDLLPTVDELNDCRSDIEKEFDEFAAEDTDRDARFNHGERHAAKLEKKLRELDPTVEVTYAINKDDEDTFYLRFGKYVYRTPFATLDAVEDTFHLWSKDDQVNSEFDKAEALNTKWKDAQRQLDKRITVEMQGSGTCAIDKDSDIRLTKIKDGYAFVDYGEIVAAGAKVVLGRYDTPAQVKEVIDEFGKSIFGNRFEFPHVEDVGKSTVELAEELTAFLLKVTPWHAGFMDLTLQDGSTAVASPRTAIIEPDWHGNGRFAFVTPWNEVFARYDTASQVRTVIYRIKHAVEDKRDKFKYPTLAELTAPDYYEKQWAVDFDIYHEDSDLTDAELESYTDKLREALTANGNRACVELEDSLITIYGDNGGNNLTVQKIVREMCKRDCWVEYPEEEGDANEKARLC